MKSFGAQICFYAIYCVYLPRRWVMYLSHDSLKTKYKMKEFKNYEIEDFIDMGSIRQIEDNGTPKRSGLYRKAMAGYPSIPYTTHPISNLDDVLNAL